MVNVERIAKVFPWRREIQPQKIEVRLANLEPKYLRNLWLPLSSYTFEATSKICGHGCQIEITVNKTSLENCHLSIGVRVLRGSSQDGYLPAVATIFDEISHISSNGNMPQWSFNANERTSGGTIILEPGLFASNTGIAILVNALKEVLTDMRMFVGHMAAVSPETLEKTRLPEGVRVVTISRQEHLAQN